MGNIITVLMKMWNIHAVKLIQPPNIITVLNYNSNPDLIWWLLKHESLSHAHVHIIYGENRLYEFNSYFIEISVIPYWLLLYNFVELYFKILNDKKINLKLHKLKISAEVKVVAKAW